MTRPKYIVHNLSHLHHHALLGHEGVTKRILIEAIFYSIFDKVHQLYKFGFIHKCESYSLRLIGASVYYVQVYIVYELCCVISVNITHACLSLRPKVTAELKSYVTGIIWSHFVRFTVFFITTSFYCSSIPCACFVYSTYFLLH